MARNNLAVSPSTEFPQQIFRQRDWSKSELGQDIAEYAIMLAVILIIVVGTIRLIGTNANSVFEKTASSISGQN